MTYRNFIYWLQGFCELADVQQFTDTQVETIKKHISIIDDESDECRDVVNQICGMLQSYDWFDDAGRSATYRSVRESIASCLTKITDGVDLHVEVSLEGDFLAATKKANRQMCLDFMPALHNVRYC